MLKDTKGTAAVEFAASSFALVTVFVMLLETASMYFAQGVLESAVERAARFAATGTAPSGMTREERLLELVSSMSLGMIDTSGVQIQTSSYASYQQAAMAGSGTAGLGGSDDVLKIEAAMTWPGLTPLMQTITGAVQLGATAVVRAERY
jgi:Flp pilus assembly protein TadG